MQKLSSLKEKVEKKADSLKEKAEKSLRSVTASTKSSRDSSGKTEQDDTVRFEDHYEDDQLQWALNESLVEQGPDRWVQEDAPATAGSTAASSAKRSVVESNETGSNMLELAQGNWVTKQGHLVTIRNSLAIFAERSATGTLGVKDGELSLSFSKSDMQYRGAIRYLDGGVCICWNDGDAWRRMETPDTAAPGRSPVETSSVTDALTSVSRRTEEAERSASLFEAEVKLINEKNRILEIKTRELQFQLEGRRKSEEDKEKQAVDRAEQLKAELAALKERNAGLDAELVALRNSSSTSNSEDTGIVMQLLDRVSELEGQLQQAVHFAPVAIAEACPQSASDPNAEAPSSTTMQRNAEFGIPRGFCDREH